jgi:hypothetical protein
MHSPRKDATLPADALGTGKSGPGPLECEPARMGGSTPLSHTRSVCTSAAGWCPNGRGEAPAEPWRSAWGTYQGRPKPAKSGHGAASMRVRQDAPASEATSSPSREPPPQTGQKRPFPATRTGPACLGRFALGSLHFARTPAKTGHYRPNGSVTSPAPTEPRASASAPSRRRTRGWNGTTPLQKRTKPDMGWGTIRKSEIPQSSLRTPVWAAIRNPCPSVRSVSSVAEEPTTPARTGQNRPQSGHPIGESPTA